MRKKVLIIGSLNMDLVIEMERMPAVGETVLGGSLSYVPGGKGANQACAVGKLGGRAAMLGCVGADDFGTKQMEGLSGVGVDISGVKRSLTKGTGIASIYVDGQGSNSIVVVAGANTECDVDYLKEHDEVIRDCDFCMLQMEIPPETVAYAADRAKELGKTVLLNPAPAPDELPEELLRKVDYLTPNETELMKLSGRTGASLEDYGEAALSLLRRGVKNILVTLGEQGSLLVNEEGIRLYPARKVDCVDTTAAGDCFNGAFVTALAEGMQPAEAICFANMASSIAVTRNGAQTSIPDREEVEAVRGGLRE